MLVIIIEPCQSGKSLFENKHHIKHVVCGAPPAGQSCTTDRFGEKHYETFELFGERPSHNALSKLKTTS